MPKASGVLQLLLAVVFLWQVPLHLQHQLTGSMHGVHPAFSTHQHGAPEGHGHAGTMLSHPVPVHSGWDSHLSRCCLPVLDQAPGLVRRLAPPLDVQQDASPPLQLLEALKVPSSARDPPAYQSAAERPVS